MHDHTDDKCIEILKNVVNAMTEGSILLLAEIVMPDTDVDWYVTQVGSSLFVVRVIAR